MTLMVLHNGEVSMVEFKDKLDAELLVKTGGMETKLEEVVECDNIQWMQLKDGFGVTNIRSVYLAKSSKYKEA